MMMVLKTKDKYINPFTDFGFKKLFGSEPNKDLLIDFLNQLLPKHHQIKDLTYTKTEQLGSSELDRNVIFDIHCTSQSGEKFIVEMQKARQRFFKDRSIFYSTFPIQEQASKGDWDYQLKAVYMVAILDFTFEEEIKESFCHRVQLKNDANRIFYDKLTYIFLEMPKFRKEESELETSFDKWCYVLKHLSEFQKRPSILQERVFEKLFRAAEIAKFTKEEKMEYEESLKIMRDNQNVIEYAKAVAFEEGKAKGRLAGKREGKIEGKIEVALNALKRGFSVKVIAEMTGLSENEIRKLKKK
jgi:predicted transposase/invertase (TIGR01784 family)